MAWVMLASATWPIENQIRARTGVTGLTHGSTSTARHGGPAHLQLEDELPQVVWRAQGRHARGVVWEAAGSRVDQLLSSSTEVKCLPA